MADQKTTTLSAFTPILTDILYGVDDPGGTPVSGKVTLTAIRDLLQANFTGLTVDGQSDLLNNTYIWAGGVQRIWLRPSLDAEIRLNTRGVFSWATGNDATGSADLQLLKDAANTLALRRTTNAQTFNIYNTFTDASNYERGGFKWATNVLEVFSEAAGTGTQRDVVLNGANRATKISDPSGGTTVDSEARTAINAIIDALEAHGISAAA